ncbi:sugar phosphate isomerase/epimerase family protein [Candidatus Pantoea floridensis]|uniref:4-hydroxyphenylpyruvate dioxygenase n=1 Tax=Candidatus Pantoea floridensis TaxID=1938870 RepID=A0A286BU67_9GAMM|nr:sugar phosphate isomerase/epimerase family protein [Pantoea floridensis]PIF13590.1 4-hydroxyphenylpyruvate dioxygenase [Enterobacteriaceae bacterium JKS000233]SOD37689.1 4-hydroxyphenylpyruvate dioxygenase [Pantoea floridensis]
MRRNPKFLNLVLLNGEPEEKLRAARAAGFDQVEIWREDVQASTPQLAKQLQLGFTNVQVLRDFTGAPDRDRQQKREELRQFIQIAQTIGCDTIQAPASTREDCVAARIDEDLRWLASEAARYNMRIMYEPMAWCSVDNTLPLAWERLQRLDQPNIGLVVDLFHICAPGGDASQLDGIPADRIYEVQLCDMAEMPPQDKKPLSEYARHQRLLPGDGIIEVERFVDKLKSAGYSGPVGIEVFNDELKAQPADVAAHKAWQALNRYWP